jgi:ferredoxin
MRVPVEFEVFPYEQATTILKDAKSFGLYPCMCKLQKTHLGEGCDHPVMSCLAFAPVEGAFDAAPGIQVLTREEAFQALRDFEDAGLVHTTGNNIESTNYICSCCTCSCTFLRALTEFGLENSVARTNFYAVVDEDACTGCGTCLDRCHFGAITMADDVSHVDRQRCAGCGLCIITCPNEARSLLRRSEDETVHTPRSIQEWNQERAESRGMSM